MRIVNKFETLRALHNTWKLGQMSTKQVKHLLATVHFIKLIKIEPHQIQAESMDGKSKYSIK